MTIAAGESTVKAEPTAAAVTPPPAVDVAALAKAAADAATAAVTKTIEEKASKVATDKLEAIGRALTGQDKPDHGQQALESFVKDPLKSLHTVKEITKQELREEMQVEQNFRNIQASVAKPFLENYPEINTPTKLALVEALTIQAQKAGDSYDVALKKGFEGAIKEFKVESVSEAIKNGNYQQGGLPHGGGFVPGAPKYSEEKSNADFLTGMKQRAAAIRTRKS